MPATVPPIPPSAPAHADDADRRAVDAGFPARLAGWLRLQHTQGVGLLSAHRLLARWPSPEAIFGAGADALRAVLKRPQAEALRQAPPGLAQRCAEVLAWLEQPGNHLLTLDDPAYPPQLRQLPDAPLLLYLKGRPALLARPAIAIVGSRNSSMQGIQMAERMGQALSEQGLAIISGMALGIDAAAHAGGLRGAGGTIAVVGTGVDRIYPARNRALAHRIAEEGCVVSEYPLGTPPLSENFPRRNRVISGLSRGVLVVEAALQSGSLITARLAGEQGREVYAVPGSVHTTLAKGCHRLIREGAKLVETAADILDDLGMLPAGAVPSWPVPDDSFVDRVLAALGGDPACADALAARLGQEVSEVQVQLLALELAGLLERLPGGLFQRLPA